MAPNSGLDDETLQQTCSTPVGYTRLTDQSGKTYLVPDFILPAAKFAAAVEEQKADINISQAPGGVSHFSHFNCRHLRHV
jgi:hypothetical protein